MHGYDKGDDQAHRKEEGRKLRRHSQEREEDHCDEAEGHYIEVPDRLEEDR